MRFTLLNPRRAASFLISTCLLFVYSSASVQAATTNTTGANSSRMCAKKSDELFVCETPTAHYAICKQSEGVHKPLAASFVTVNKQAPTPRLIEPILPAKITYTGTAEGAKATTASLQFSTEAKKIHINYELSAAERDAAWISVASASRTSAVTRAQACIGEPTINDYVFTLNYDTK